jgi:hypothetical protein
MHVDCNLAISVGRVAATGIDPYPPLASTCEQRAISLKSIVDKPTIRFLVIPHNSKGTPS